MRLIVFNKYLALFAGTLLVSSSLAISETTQTMATLGGADIPVLQEQAAKAGINHTYDGPWEYFVGGGVATMDCNGDRRPDIIMAGGSNPAQLFINQSSTGGELKFAKKSLDIDPNKAKNVTGIYPLDVDNDGHKDLIFLRVGENLILKGGPDCSFTNANTSLALMAAKHGQLLSPQHLNAKACFLPWHLAITWTGMHQGLRGEHATIMCLFGLRILKNRTTAIKRHSRRVIVHFR
jgi:hypothetical protein